MEVAGVVLAGGGLAGLLSLFSTCIDLIQTVDSCKAFGQKYYSLLVQLDVEKASLLQWNEAVGLFSSNPRSQHPALKQKPTRVAIENVLICMKELLTNTEQLRLKYGLVESNGSKDSTSSALATIVSKPRLRAFNEACAQFRFRVSRQQKETRLLAKLRWAIRDHDAFQCLVDQIHRFVRSLWDLLPVPSQFERLVVKEDIENLPEDLSTLRLVDDACSRRGDHWSEAASMRLASSESATQDPRNVMQWIGEIESIDIQETSDTFSRGVGTSLRAEGHNLRSAGHESVRPNMSVNMYLPKKCDEEFAQWLFSQRCYLEGLMQNNPTIISPTNIAEILCAMKKEPSPLLVSSLSMQSFQQFKELIATSPNDAAEKFIIPFLTGHRNQACCRLLSQSCRLRPALDGYIYLPSLDVLDNNDPTSVRESRRPVLALDKFHNLFIAPYLILEVASSRESLQALRIGTCYHGALAADIMIRQRMSGISGRVFYDGNAYSFTSTFHNGTLQIFTTCKVPGRDRRSTEYHTTCLGTWKMTASVSEYQQGVTALRNISAFAHAKRAELINLAYQNQRFI